MEVTPTSEEPARWGDYLEETLEQPMETKVVRMAPAPQAREAAVARTPMPDPVPDPAPPPVRSARPISATAQEPTPEPTLAGRPRERFQLNVTPETRRVAEGLLNHVVTVGIEKTTTHADIFEALIHAAYEARELLNLRAVRHRGRWGTPTASAFRVALKTALAQAIAEHMKQQDGRSW